MHRAVEEFRTRGFIPWSKIDHFLHLYFISARGLQKPRNLARQPWIVVHAGDGDDVIILEGPAEIVADHAELQKVDAAYREKYVDPGSGAQATIFEPEADFYRVNVKHVMAWEYGTMAHRTDWKFR